MLATEVPGGGVAMDTPAVEIGTDKPLKGVGMDTPVKGVGMDTPLKGVGMDTPLKGVGFFDVKETPGKGVGCFALRPIQPGTLILRETPAILLREEGCGSFPEIIDSFRKLSDEDKKEFFTLADDKSEIHMKDEALDAALEKGEIVNMSKAEAAKILGIVETNSFPRGLCLHMCRVNHACGPNAEYLWNKDIQTQELRAIKQIDTGEEILVSYIRGLKSPLNRESRRTYLHKVFNFWCECQVCKLTGEDLRQNELARLKVAKLHKVFLAGGLSSPAGLKYVNEFITAIINCGAVGVNEILVNILEKAFKDACLECAKQKAINPILFLLHLKAATDFSRTGVDLSCLLWGEDHSATALWRKRNENPLEECPEESCCTL